MPGSGYRFIAPTRIMDAVAVSSTNTYNSLALDLLTMSGCAMQVSWTGTPTGTFVVAGSNDGTAYFDIGASIPSQPSGSTGSFLLNNVGIQCRYIRVQYTNSSGSGTVTAIGSAKTGM